MTRHYFDGVGWVDDGASTYDDRLDLIYIEREFEASAERARMARARAARRRIVRLRVNLATITAVPLLIGAIEALTRS